MRCFVVCLYEMIGARFITTTPFFYSNYPMNGDDVKKKQQLQQRTGWLITQSAAPRVAEPV